MDYSSLYRQIAAEVMKRCDFPDLTHSRRENRVARYQQNLDHMARCFFTESNAIERGWDDVDLEYLKRLFREGVEPVDIDVAEEPAACARCGTRTFESDCGKFNDGYVGRFRSLFFGNAPKEIYYIYCQRCAIEIEPFIVKLRDIFELEAHNNLLLRTINEKRNKDDRTASFHVGKRGKGSDERRFGHR